MNTRADYAKARSQWLEAVVIDLKLRPAVHRAAMVIGVRHFNVKAFVETGRLVAWPGYERLAQEIGCTKRAAIAAVGDLVSAGYLASPATRVGGRGHANELLGCIKGEADFTLWSQERVKYSAVKGEVQRQERVKPASPHSIDKTLVEDSGCASHTCARAISPGDIHKDGEGKPQPPDEQEPRVIASKILPGGGRVIRVVIPQSWNIHIPRRPLLKADDIAEALAAWNALAGELGLPVAQKLTAARRSLLAARLKDAGGLDGWRAALDRIRQSEFLSGGKWRVSLDWVVQQANFTKLMEGNYADTDRQRRGTAPHRGHRRNSSADVFDIAEGIIQRERARKGH